MLSRERWARFTGRRNPDNRLGGVPEELLVLGSETRMGPPAVYGSQVGPSPSGSTTFSVSDRINAPAGGFNGGDILAWFPRDQVSGTITAVQVIDKTYFFAPGIYRYHFSIGLFLGASDFAYAFTFAAAGPGNPVAFPWGPSGYTVMVRRPANASHRSEVWGRVFLPTPFGVILSTLQAQVNGDATYFDATIENDQLLDEQGSGGHW